MDEVQEQLKLGEVRFEAFLEGFTAITERHAVLNMRALALAAIIPHLPRNERASIVIEALAIAAISEDLERLKCTILQIAPFCEDIPQQVVLPALRDSPDLPRWPKQEWHEWIADLPKAIRDSVIDFYYEKGQQSQHEYTREKISQIVTDRSEITELTGEHDIAPASWASLVEELLAVQTRDELLRAISEKSKHMAEWSGVDGATRIAQAIYEFGRWKC